MPTTRTHRRVRRGAGPATARFVKDDLVAYRVWRFRPFRGWSLEPRDARVIAVSGQYVQVVTDHDGGQRCTFREDQLEPWTGVL